MAKGQGTVAVGGGEGMGPIGADIHELIRFGDDKDDRDLGENATGNDEPEGDNTDADGDKRVGAEESPGAKDNDNAGEGSGPGRREVWRHRRSVQMGVDVGLLSSESDVYSDDSHDSSGTED